MDSTVAAMSRFTHGVHTTCAMFLCEIDLQNYIIQTEQALLTALTLDGKEPQSQSTQQGRQL